MKTAAVMGAGIQGVCIALMLHKLNYKVYLIERGDDVINYTSKNGEGKIHLGLVYGLDKSLKTAKKLNLDALHFSNCLEHLLDNKPDWKSLQSTPFYYLVAHDSMLSEYEIEGYFETIQYIYEGFITDPKLNYFGARPERIFSQVQIPDLFNKSFVRKSFKTEEVAIHTKSIKSILKNKILSTSISLHLNTEVREVKRGKESFQIESTISNGDRLNLKSDIVVNCLWGNKIKFDEMMGLKMDNYSLRLKYGLRIHRNQTLGRIPSFSIIQGPYGDFVDFPDFNEIYISWYPSTMKGFITEGGIPTEWNVALNNIVDESLIEHLKIENYKAYKKIIPDFPPIRIKNISGGVILARGQRDIDEHGSALHNRNEFPIKSKDGYYSINTGKYTSGPYNARILERILSN